MQELIKKRTKQVGVDVILLIDEFPHSIAIRAIAINLLNVRLL